MNQMAVLFDNTKTNIRKHKNNNFRSLKVDKNNITQKMNVNGAKRVGYNESPRSRHGLIYLALISLFCGFRRKWLEKCN